MWLGSDGWGSGGQALPGQWTALVLIIVAAGVLGFLVLWFTMLRQERTVLHRARRRPRLRPELRPELLGGTGTALLRGAAAEPSAGRFEPVEQADAAAEPMASVGADSEADAEADGGIEAGALTRTDTETGGRVDTDSRVEAGSPSSADPRPSRTDQP